MTAHRDWRSLLAAVAALLSAAALPGTGLAAPNNTYPSQESLRDVQLAALACARENTAESCRRTAGAVVVGWSGHPS